MDTILKLYRHRDWANKQILSLLQKTITENANVTRLFSHILLAEQIWFIRIMGGDTSDLQIWNDDMDIVACKKLLDLNNERYASLLKNLSLVDWEKEITYKNTQGKEFVNSIGDILTHVALHGQHHRGQINQTLRANGITPAGIDYISMVR